VSDPQRLRVVQGDGIEEDAPPHSIPAEQFVLGSAMLSPMALAEVRGILDGSEFWRPAHRLIWDAICELADAGNPHDPISVTRALGSDLGYARDVLEASYRLAHAPRSSDIGPLRATVATETTALTEAARRGWPDPVPLSASVDLPEFPLWALPAWLGEY
jgi:replicative DNA helicase